MKRCSSWTYTAHAILTAPGFSGDCRQYLINFCVSAGDAGCPCMLDALVYFLGFGAKLLAHLSYIVYSSLRSSNSHENS